MPAATTGRQHIGPSQVAKTMITMPTGKRINAEEIALH
jgi:hypothetical protein